eukprot:354987-Chlamydomonas_euryale.AAC.6
MHPTTLLGLNHPTNPGNPPWNSPRTQPDNLEFPEDRTSQPGNPEDLTSQPGNPTHHLASSVLMRRLLFLEHLSAKHPTPHPIPLSLRTYKHHAPVGQRCDDQAAAVTEVLVPILALCVEHAHEQLSVLKVVPQPRLPAEVLLRHDAVLHHLRNDVPVCVGG